MTIFRFDLLRSDWKSWIAWLCLIVGLLGFFACWSIVWMAEQRIFGDPKFEHATGDRPESIEMKGQTYYVEPTYGHRYRVATSMMSYIWAVGAGGMIYLKRREMKAKGK